jgi:hypothetical protein
VPSASSGYAVAQDSNSVNYGASGNSYYYGTPQAATGYAAAAAAARPTSYDADPYGNGYYANQQATAAEDSYAYPPGDEANYYGYYGDAGERQTDGGAGDTYAGGETYGEAYSSVGATGVGAAEETSTDQPPREGDHTAEFLNQLLLFAVAIVAILYGFLVTPWIVSGLGFISSFFPVIITALAPIANLFLSPFGLSLCTITPLELFPGAVTAGRARIGGGGEGPLTPAEAMAALWSMLKRVPLIGENQSLIWF